MAYTNIPKKLMDILQCVECGATSIVAKSGEMECKNCGRRYEILNNIPNLLPTKPICLPKIYQDQHYKIWNDNLAIAQDYFYKSTGIVSFVQNAGHRAVRDLCRNKYYEITLDIGCGDGAHCPFLKNSEGYFGIDSSQQSLEKLKSKFPNLFVIRANAYKLPFRDRSVNCIINIYNLEHMVYLDLVLEEMSRVLFPEGDVFISVPNEGGYAWTLGRNISTVRKFTTDTFNYKRAVEIEHVNCIWQLEKVFKRHFHIKRRIYFPFRLPIMHFNLITTYHCELRKGS